MELKEFIKQTIIQITDGLREGHEYVTDNDYGAGVEDGFGKKINFDIAVTSNEEEMTGVGGKLTIASMLSLGAKGENSTKASNVSRIQFDVTLRLKIRKS